MKKRIILAVSVILGIFVAGLIIGTVFLSNLGLGISKGTCLVSDNGTYFLIKDESPITMSYRGIGENNFDTLTTGDSIIVIHSGIEETYPGRTGVYFVVKLHDGDEQDIPRSVIEMLCELGWLSE